jgi:hypothetical protein
MSEKIFPDISGWNYIPSSDTDERTRMWTDENLKKELISKRIKLLNNQKNNS